MGNKKKTLRNCLRVRVRVLKKKGARIVCVRGLVLANMYALYHCDQFVFVSGPLDKPDITNWRYRIDEISCSLT